MKFKNLKPIAYSAVAALALVGTQFACAEIVQAGDTIHLDQKFSNLDAGVFNATASHADGSALSSGGSFLTFCLESTVGIYDTMYVKGVTNSVESTSYSWNWGWGGPVVTSTVTKTPLQAQTEWLFTQFNTNASFKNTYSSSSVMSDALQNAIWYEQGQSTSNYGSLAQNLVALANSAVKNGWTDQYNQVRVLNLYGDKNYTYQAQDQLYFVSAVPEPQTFALMLAGMGLVVAFARRRKRQTV